MREVGKLSLMSPAGQKQHAHELVDRLDTGQLDAVVRLLEVMIDPVARAIANAPIEDEPISEEGIKALDEAREWLKHNKAIPREQVLADSGSLKKKSSATKKNDDADHLDRFKLLHPGMRLRLRIHRHRSAIARSCVSCPRSRCIRATLQRTSESLLARSSSSAMVSLRGCRLS